MRLHVVPSTPGQGLREDSHTASDAVSGRGHLLVNVMLEAAVERPRHHEVVARMVEATPVARNGMVNVELEARLKYKARSVGTAYEILAKGV